jgi:hypothetical protein
MVWFAGTFCIRTRIYRAARDTVHLCYFDRLRINGATEEDWRNVENVSGPCRFKEFSPGLFRESISRPIFGQVTIRLYPCRWQAQLGSGHRLQKAPDYRGKAFGLVILEPVTSALNLFHPDAWVNNLQLSCYLK